MVAPKLRFKEFDGDWSRYKIAEVTEYLVDGTHFSPKTTEGEFKYITSKNIRNDGLDLTNISYISKDEHEKIYKRCKVQLGDILLTKDGANTGNCCLNTLDEEFSLLSSVAVLRGKKDSFNNNFILQILQSDLGQDTIISSMSGQAITRITLAKLKDYSFFFPELTEQTQITSFLSAVDEKISQLTQKHALLRQYKQGMMQKLFSQQLRFKADDGSEFGEWKSVFLGDISKPQQWKTISSSELTEIGYPVFGANGYIGFYPKYNHINETIAVTCRGATCGEVTLVKAKSYITGNAMSIDEINENEHSTLYIYYALCFRGFKDVISGSAQPQIVGNAIRKVTFQITCLEEQTKIANFLSTIDQKIEVVAQQIEQAKMWKKGLLQQMFV